MPGANLRQRALERARRHAAAPLDQRDLAGVLPLAQRLDEIDRRPPLPARARLEQPLKVAVQQVRGLEAERPRRPTSCASCCHSPVHRLCGSMRDVREIADFLARPASDSGNP